MKILGPLISLCLALCLAGAARAEGWTVKVKVINGRVTYSYDHKVPLGAQGSYNGKAQVRGLGVVSEVTLGALLNRPVEGLYRLDYQVELSGEQKARPPFQAAGKVLLRPGKPVLAAEAEGWKLVLELQGPADGKTPKKGTETLETSLKCGRASYPASFVYLPDEQYSAVLFSGTDEEVRKFMVGLLPNSPALDGTFLLQYTFLLREGGEVLASGQGELILEPGGEKMTASAGKDCVFSAKALR